MLRGRGTVTHARVSAAGAALPRTRSSDVEIHPPALTPCVHPGGGGGERSRFPRITTEIVITAHACRSRAPRRERTAMTVTVDAPLHIPFAC